MPSSAGSIYHIAPDVVEILHGMVARNLLIKQFDGAIWINPLFIPSVKCSASTLLPPNLEWAEPSSTRNEQSDRGSAGARGMIPQRHNAEDRENKMIREAFRAITARKRKLLMNWASILPTLYPEVRGWAEGLLNRITSVKIRPSRPVIALHFVFSRPDYVFTSDHRTRCGDKISRQ